MKRKEEMKLRVEMELAEDRRKVEAAIDRQSDAALDDAIRRGMEGGRTGARKRRAGAWLPAVAAAICVAVFLMAAVRVSPAFASMLREVPGLSGFVDILNGDPVLKQAVNEDFMQPVNLSDVKGNYKLTVSGVIADEQRFVIFYSVENKNGESAVADDGFKLEDGEGNPIRATMGFSMPTQEEAGAPVHYETVDVHMSGDNPVPDAVRLHVTMEEHELQVEFPIDHTRFADAREAIEVNRSFEVGGQRFTIGKAIITPLQTTLTMTSDPSNSLKANHFVQLALVDEKGRKMPYQGAFGMLDEGNSTLQFESSYFQRPKKLTLEASGLLVSERNKKMVINTETGETLETPDSRVVLEKTEEKPDSLRLTFRMTDLKAEEEWYGYTLFDSEDPFMDGNGKSYRIQSGYDGTISEYSSEGYRTYYTIPKADYKQPLTFDVYQYPGYVPEQVNVKIK